LDYIFSHPEEYPEFKKYEYLYDKMSTLLVYLISNDSRNKYEIMCEFVDIKYDSDDIDYFVRFFINIDTLEYKVDIEISYHNYAVSDVIHVKSGVLPGNKIHDMLLMLFGYCDDAYKKFNK
jgi:hypothetical protein